MSIGSSLSALTSLGMSSGANLMRGAAGGLTNPMTVNGFAHGMVNSGANSVMRGLLGMDTTPCPKMLGIGKYGKNHKADKCGTHDDPLKSALLAVGMALAGPVLSQAGDLLGGAMNGGLGMIQNGVGTSLGLVSNTLTDTFGFDKKVVANGLGSATGAVVTGGNLSEAGVSGLTSGLNSTASKISSDNLLASSKSNAGWF